MFRWSNDLLKGWKYKSDEKQFLLLFHAHLSSYICELLEFVEVDKKYVQLSRRRPLKNSLDILGAEKADGRNQGENKHSSFLLLLLDNSK